MAFQKGEAWFVMARYRSTGYLTPVVDEDGDVMLFDSEDSAQGTADEMEVERGYQVEYGVYEAP